MTKSVLSYALPRALPCALIATLPMLAAAWTGSVSAQTVEGSGSSKVMMFDRPPSVEELREVVAPEPKLRTRSIEIIGGAAGAAAKRPRPVDEINYGSAPIPPAAQPAPQTAPSRPVHKQRRQEVRMEAPAAEMAAAPPPAAAPAPAPEAAPQAFGFRINFALNSAEIPAESASYIDAVGALMKEDPTLGLTVEGHTDATGSLPYNMLLSQRRAVSVGEYLVRVHQIDPKRITVDGKGPTVPLAANPYDGRNRRVEFKPTH